jgi:hypothetical protein
MNLLIDGALNYTFVRLGKIFGDTQILEYRNSEYVWTNDLNNCLGYFKGCCVNDLLCKQLNDSLDHGFSIYVNSFDENGNHIQTISQDGVYND